MDAQPESILRSDTHEVIRPARQMLPLVFASPHSGRDYSPQFLASSKLDALSLRRSEDSFVDEIFAAAPRLGAPLIRALFPRAFIDPNREPFELDPLMFEDSLPHYANTRSPRVAAGLGTIARVVATGAEIYRQKLTFQEALDRVQGYYWPYHTGLSELIAETKGRFGYCILVDCHSMPSIGGPLDNDSGLSRTDFILGDCHGAACASVVTRTVARTLERFDHVVRFNNPYSGGFVTRHYGRPRRGVHVLQVEINRALYMEESSLERRPELARLAEEMEEVISALGSIAADRLSVDRC